MKARFVLSLCLLELASHAPVAMAQSAGTFTATGNMITARFSHTATLLLNGKVLIAGGILGEAPGATGLFASAELYDPATGTFTATGSMTTPRSLHTATLLPDGRVLVAGGSTSARQVSPTNSAEIYDPGTGTFAPTGNMISSHACQQASPLRNGEVLISGGSADASDSVPSAELYDPATAAFAAAGTYVTNPSGFNDCVGAASALLPDGRVLIIWEEQASELYDPNAGSFTQTRPIVGSYNDGLPTATLLTNGKVLVAGGADDSGIHTSVYLYDPATGRFGAAGNMTSYRVYHTATLLPDSSVLMAGTLLFGGATLATAELYDPIRGAFTATGNMTTARALHTATLLTDGSVLMAGGIGGTSSAEIYHPAVLVPAPSLFSVSGDGRGQGAILHANTPRVASSSDPAVAGDYLEIYLTGLADASVIPPQVSIGGRMAEVVYFGKSGYPGANQVNVRVPSGVTPGPAVPVRLTYIGRPSNEVTIGVQ